MGFKEIRDLSEKYRRALEKAIAAEKLLTPEEREAKKREADEKEFRRDLLHQMGAMRLRAQMREAGYDV